MYLYRIIFLADILIFKIMFVLPVGSTATFTGWTFKAKTLAAMGNPTDTEGIGKA